MYINCMHHSNACLAYTYENSAIAYTDSWICIYTHIMLYLNMKIVGMHCKVVQY